MATPKSKTCGRCGKRKPLSQYVSARGRFCGPCRKGTRKRASLSSHDERQVETYGYRPGEWRQLHDAQGGVCAICKGKRLYNLDSDHDHKTGHLRGQCCKSCNRWLLKGARDNIEILKSAIEYLQDPPAKRVLGIRVHIEKRKES